MFKLKQHPQHILLAASIVILIASFFSFDYMLDIHLHDTYYVISYYYIFLGLALFTWICWIINHLCRNLQYFKWMTWLHVILVLMAVVIISGDLLFFSESGLAGSLSRYFEYSNSQMYFTGGMKSILIGMLLLATAAFVLPVNITIGLFKRRKI